jgi:hypothetical protein
MAIKAMFNNSLIINFECLQQQLIQRKMDNNSIQLREIVSEQSPFFYKYI